MKGILCKHSRLAHSWSVQKTIMSTAGLGGKEMCQNEIRGLAHAHDRILFEDVLTTYIYVYIHVYIYTNVLSIYE